MRKPRFSNLPSVFWVVAWWLGVVCAAALQTRQGLPTPPPAGFVRRSYAVGAVLGDFAYIDGGEVSQLSGGQPAAGAAPKAESSTLSISLRESWNNSAVPIQVISKPAPLLNSQAIWTDESTNSFLTWGGAAANGTKPPTGQAWQFFADGSGGGSWSPRPPSNPRIFNELARPVGCAHTQGDGVGYCIGGLLSSQSGSSVAGDTALAGIVSFAMISSVWRNTSISRTLVNARAELVPFGPNGLILLLGGTSDALPPGLVDFANITYYDPTTKQFFSQKTTGTIPAGRQRFCSVGVQGPNKTFEVFLYGGLTADNTVSDEVFVLSLPGFVFVKAESPGATTPRAGHSCVVVGGGKRQMLSIGGTDASRGYPGEFADPDPWAHGLGVFDMTSLRWKDGYAHDAAPYDTPEVLKHFYRDGGLRKVQWASSDVEIAFNNGFAAAQTNHPRNAATDVPRRPGGSGALSGLSRSAILGISIGTTAALPMLIAVLYFLCCRGRPTTSMSRSATAKTTVQRHPRRRRSEASSEASHHFEACQRSAGPSTDSGGEKCPAPPPLPSARRSRSQHRAHIKGKATPIVVDDIPPTTKPLDVGAEKQGQQRKGQQPQPQPQPQPQLRKPQSPTLSKRVRFSALLRPPQRKPVPALQPQLALGGNPVTIYSDLADRRGRPPLQAIRTRLGQSVPGESALAKGGTRVYQERPS